MPADGTPAPVAVFDLGGTWFRWGLYQRVRGLVFSQDAPAINYLSHPRLSADELQIALLEFIAARAQELRATAGRELQTVIISLGAPVNAHDMTVLGSGPLWGPTAKPFRLQARLREAVPDLAWHVVNDITALLAPYMQGDASCRKTMLITVSSGIGSRLYDHRAHRIPFDTQYGIQGEIGHLVFPFELDGKLFHMRCDCGGWDHMNAFSSGRGIARILRALPSLSSIYAGVSLDPVEVWQQASEEYRLRTFQTQLAVGNESASSLLDALVTPLARALAAALSLDPEIDRIVITGGVARGLGTHYREALQRVFMRDGLYQITEHDTDYLARRLIWDDTDDFSGLRGAGIYAERMFQ